MSAGVHAQGWVGRLLGLRAPARGVGGCAVFCDELGARRRWPLPSHGRPPARPLPSDLRPHSPAPPSPPRLLPLHGARGVPPRAVQLPRRRLLLLHDRLPAVRGGPRAGWLGAALLPVEAGGWAREERRPAPSPWPSTSGSRCGGGWRASRTGAVRRVCRSGPGGGGRACACCQPPARSHAPLPTACRSSSRPVLAWTRWRRLRPPTVNSHTLQLRPLLHHRPACRSSSRRLLAWTRWRRRARRRCTSGAPSSWPSCSRTP